MKIFVNPSNTMFNRICYQSENSVWFLGIHSENGFYTVNIKHKNYPQWLGNYFAGEDLSYALDVLMAIVSIFNAQSESFSVKEMLHLLPKSSDRAILDCLDRVLDQCQVQSV